MNAPALPCPRCGVQLRPGKPFCGNCGIQLVAAPPAPAAQPPVQRSSHRTGRWIAIGAALGLIAGLGAWVGLTGPFGDSDHDAVTVADVVGATSSPTVSASPTASSSPSASASPSSSCLPYSGAPEDDSTEHPYLQTAMSGSCREDVQRLQQALGLSADGFFDQETADAVISRQAPYSCITATGGKVGPQTWKLIVEGDQPCTPSVDACAEDDLREATNTSGDRPLADRQYYSYFKVDGCAANWALVFSNLSGASWEGFFLMRRDGAAWQILQGVQARPADGISGIFDCGALGSADVAAAKEALGDDVAGYSFCR